MRIGIFTNNYLPNPYGVTASIESFRHELERCGHEVFVFAPRYPDYQDCGRHVFRYPALDVKVKFRFPLPIHFSPKMSRILESLELDIIHSQHPNLLGSAAKSWARKKQIPLVFTWHTLYDRYVHFVPFVPRRLAAWWVIRQAVKYANQSEAVIVPTVSAEKIIRGWGLKNGYMAVLATGVENVFQGADGTVVRRRFEIANDAPVLFTVCRLTSEKNVEYLFREVFSVLQMNEQAIFLVVGDGNLGPRLRQLATAAGVAERVILAGEVPKEKIKDYYAAGNIFVYASKSETQGVIIAEAMYSGLPVVAVRATGVEDYVQDGQTGFLVNGQAGDLAHATQRLLDDSPLRENFSVAAKKIATEHYTAAVATEKLLAVYADAIARKKRD
ncbi:glycosyltransferase family 4 protein [Patescibacteria group bacterium]|nr:MAG: glycosyltransferase family 4 protein [Patescibacteria group bacterium]